jgi:ATP-dependent DNA ligase
MAIETRTFESKSSDAVYTAKLDPRTGESSCNCPGWRNKREGKPRQCKHTLFLEAEYREERGAAASTIRRHTRAEAAAGRAQAAPQVVKVPKPHVLGDYSPVPTPKMQPTTAPPVAAPKPMLASAMVDAVTGAAFDARYGSGEWVMEEKLDGHRLTVTVKDGQVHAFSRATNARALPPHIIEQMRSLPPGVYDGELVAPSGKAWDVTVIGTHLVFVIFDLLECGGSLCGLPYAHRRSLLLSLLRALPEGQMAVSTVESLPPSWAGVQAIWARGGEGVILKRVASTYRPDHRSADWVKVKAVHAATLTITAFQPGKSGPYSALELRDAGGASTTVKTLDNALLRAIAADPGAYLGRRVVVSYQEKTPSGSYRHPMFDHFAGEGE